MVLLGSSFTSDLKADYTFQELQKIVLVIQRGQQLILKDHERVYGSLYDLLNQSYNTVRDFEVVDAQSSCSVRSRCMPARIVLTQF